jgi:peptide/nickel transport system substrate-binding protein
MSQWAWLVRVIIAMITTVATTAWVGKIDAAPRGLLRVAVVNFDRESTAQWLGSTPMLPYIGNLNDPFIAADDNGQLSADGIITAWQAHPAGDGIILTVRPGVKFHHGEEVTAEDIKFSIETWQRPQASVGISGPALRGAVKSVEVLDTYRVQVTLTSPNAIFPHLLSWVEGDIAVIPKQYFMALPGNTFEEKEAAFIKAPVGTGPWKFVKRNVATDIEFGANPDYWNEQRRPQFARLRVLKVPEVSTRMNMLRTGEVDLAVVDSDAARSLAREGLTLFVVRNVAHALLVFYKCYDPQMLTHDVRFRQAATLALDRQAIVKALFPPLSSAMGSLGALSAGGPLTGPGVAGYDTSVPTYPYDPRAARQLLKDMGYLDNPKTIVANSFAFASLPEGPKFIEAIAGYWEAVGIKVQIKQVDLPFVAKKLAAAPQEFEPPGEVGVQSPWYRPSGLNNFRVFAVSRPELKTQVEQERGLEAGGALAGHCDPNKADALYLDALRIMDPAQLTEAIRKINRDTYDDYWSIPMVSRSEAWAARAGVVGDWRPVPLGPVYLRFETAVPGPAVQ